MRGFERTPSGSATELTKVQAKVEVDLGTNCPSKPDDISQETPYTVHNCRTQVDRYIIYEGVKILKT